MDKPELAIRILGTGTSSGVPVIGCQCSVCQSTNPHDKRTRSSIHVRQGETNVLIDTTPDLRQQALKYTINNLDAVLYTHHHFDHIGGFDDLRAYNFIQNKLVDIYGKPETLNSIKQTFKYAFETNETQSSRPMVRTHEITDTAFKTAQIEWMPLKLKHGSLEILGYRTGNFAYCTDTSSIPESTMEKLKGLDVLVLSALRHEPHPMHLTIEEAQEVAKVLNPRHVWLTHLAHQVSHKRDGQSLSNGIQLAYDGLKITIASDGTVTTT